MADFFLTRTAFIELGDIYRYSIEQWGEQVAERYLADLYEAFAAAATQPTIGDSRQARSMPFLMMPARSHFVVYDRVPVGVIIATVIHQMRDVEVILAELAPELSAEIEAVKTGLRRNA